MRLLPFETFPIRFIFITPECFCQLGHLPLFLFLFIQEALAFRNIRPWRHLPLLRFIIALEGLDSHLFHLMVILVVSAASEVVQAVVAVKHATASCEVCEYQEDLLRQDAIPLLQSLAWLSTLETQSAPWTHPVSTGSLLNLKCNSTFKVRAYKALNAWEFPIKQASKVLISL